MISLLLKQCIQNYVPCATYNWIIYSILIKVVIYS